MEKGFKMFKHTLVFLLVLSMVIVPVGNCYAAQSWNKGAKVNYQPSSKDTVYKTSDWIKNLNELYQMKWYENPTRNVLKGEFMLLQLRTIQASLERRGLELLSDPSILMDFKDYNTLTKSAQEEAKVLYSLGILSGTSNGYMKLENELTRAEAAKILDVTNSKLLKIPTIRAAKTFTDIKGHWAEKNITAVYQTGLLNGVSDTKFNPNANLTIEQAFQILENEVGYYGISRLDVAKALTETFKVTTTLHKSNAEYSLADIEDKMFVYGFSEIYENASVKSSEKVTKLEALKMAYAAVCNFGNINQFYFHEDLCNNEFFLEDMEYKGIINTTQGFNSSVKGSEMLDYLAKLSKMFLEKDIAGELKSLLPEMPMDKTLNKGMLNEIVINFVEKYSTITVHNDEILKDVDKMPSNYKMYPFILSSVDKRIYEIPNNFVDKYDYADARTLYREVKYHYKDIDAMVTKYLNTVLNVDYQNLDEAKFKENVRSVSLFSVSDTAFKEYFDYVKSNKIQISGTAEVQYPAIYFDGFVYRARVKIVLDIKNAVKPDNLIFRDLGQMGTVRYKGKHIVRVVDFALSRYYNTLDFGVYVSALTPIGLSQTNQVVYFENTFND